MEGTSKYYLPTDPVSVVKMDAYTDVSEAKERLTELLEPLGGLDAFGGKNVVIKANLVSAMKPEEAATTHPTLLCALTDILKERGVKCQSNRTMNMNLSLLWPIEIKNIFADLGFPEPKPIPLMSIPFQVSQKLHGVTQPGSSRVRDLIDLQLIMNNEKFDIGVTADICRNLFNYRKMHVWPTYVVKGEGWDSVYVAQRGDLSVAETCDEAVRIVNGLIDQLDMA
jgi:hypothetical protein